MERIQRSQRWLFGLLALVAAAAFLVGNAAAQEKKVEHRPAGPHNVTVEVKHGTVLLVEGNHVVARLENGKVEAIEIPEGFRFHMDGRLLSVHELEPGMLITHETIITTKPMLVRTVEVKDGIIWNINGPRVIIRDRSNKLHDYSIPAWAEVVVNGAKMTVFELRKGMKINATIITEETVNYIESEAKSTVSHPPNAPGETLKEPESMPPAANPPARREQKPEPAMAKLPKTAGPVPLAGLLGLLSLAASFGLRRLRKEF